ncbi:hypothetical protein J0910_30350 [Nocardiopsis sp. CNT-189]|uniref:hypothetical protein n=1 Tax=Nocardiopsis oceanisediminis TaxID=2816862 RepID=UPI003B333738
MVLMVADHSAEQDTAPPGEGLPPWPAALCPRDALLAGAGLFTGHSDTDRLLLAWAASMKTDNTRKAYRNDVLK